VRTKRHHRGSRADGVRLPARERDARVVTARHQAVLALQRSAGNLALSRLIDADAVQRKDGAEAPKERTDHAATMRIEGIADDIPVLSLQIRPTQRRRDERDSTTPADVEMTLHADHRATIALQRAVYAGDVFPTVTITMRGRNVVLTNVVVSGLSLGGGEPPVVQVTMNAADAKFE
jgi:hypothetical protein